MKVTRRSNLSGKERTLDIPVTQDQLARYERGEGYVQDIFPHLSADEREFLMTGITAEEWNIAFATEDRTEPED